MLHSLNLIIIYVLSVGILNSICPALPQFLRHILFGFNVVNYDAQETLTFRLNLNWLQNYSTWTRYKPCSCIVVVVSV